MSPVDRRGFLRSIAAAAGVSLVPATAEAETGARAAPVWQRTTCPLCSVGCGLLVRIQDGRAVAVKGDPDSPVSNGLACAKGYHVVQALYARDRIRHAQVRRNGALVDVPLKEALDVVATRLRDTIAQHGPGSVGLYGAAQQALPDTDMAARLFAGAIGTQHYDTEARLHGASGSAGRLSTFGLDAPVATHDDIEHADTFVLWHENVAETHPVLFARMLARRRRDAAVRIIDLSTRTTRTSYAADRSILYAPHAEIALAHGICHELNARRAVDRDFMARHVAFMKGRTVFAAGDTRIDDNISTTDFAAYVEFLRAYMLDRVQQFTGVRAEDIRWLAALYGDRARRVLSVWGAGLNRHARGTWANNTVYNIHLLTDKLGTAGNSALCLTPPLAAGITGDALAMFRALESGAMRFLWIQGADPLVSLPHARRYRRAAALADRFVVVSAAYPSPTTDSADVVLPSAWWLERDATTSNAEGRVLHAPQLVRPPGDALSDAAQLLEVARRIGHGGVLPRAFTGVSDDRAANRYRTASDPQADRTRGAVDFYGHADHRARIWLRPHQPAPEAPDAQYPFWLMTGEVLEHSDSGTFTQRIATLHRAVPHAYVELNRADALALGVRSGDLVRITTRRGSLDLTARIDVRSQPQRGQLFVPSFDETHPIHTITLDVCCPISGQPDVKCAARIARVSPGATP